MSYESDLNAHIDRIERLGLAAEKISVGRLSALQAEFVQGLRQHITVALNTFNKNKSSLLLAYDRAGPADKAKLKAELDSMKKDWDQAEYEFRKIL